LKTLTKYNNLYNNYINPYKYIIVTVLMLTTIIVIFKKVEFNKYYSNSGIVISNHEIEIYVNRKDLNKVYNNKKIIINNKNFAYNIKNISEPIYYNDYYYKIILKVKILDNLNIKNNFIDFKILLEKQTILKYILKKVGG